MNRCEGCGVLSIKKLCDRCFNIKNYSKYTKTNIDNQEFEKLINEVNDSNDLVVLVVDLLNLNPDLSLINKLKNNILLVLTKRDLLPSGINDNKLLNYLKTDLNVVDKVVISSLKNYNFDTLFAKIKNYKTTNKVYIMGYTNSGKSSMVNKIIKNYTNKNMEITTSILPNTTLGKLEIKIEEDLYLIDTPGILDKGNICYYLDDKTLKKIIPKNKIKPRTYQINKMQYVLVDNILRLDIQNNNITFFINNNLDIKRYYKDFEVSLEKHEIHINKNNDLVIQGLGFIKFTKEEDIIVYTIKDVAIYQRVSLI